MPSLMTISSAVRNDQQQLSFIKPDLQRRQKQQQQHHYETFNDGIKEEEEDEEIQHYEDEGGDNVFRIDEVEIEKQQQFVVSSSDVIRRAATISSVQLNKFCWSFLSRNLITAAEIKLTNPTFDIQQQQQQKQQHLVQQKQKQRQQQPQLFKYHHLLLLY